MESACSPRAGIGFPQVLRFPLSIKDMHVRVNTPVSAPEQGTGKRSGVGPRALYCGSPLILACVLKVNYEYDGLYAEDQFPQRDQ